MGSGRKDSEGKELQNWKRGGVGEANLHLGPWDLWVTHTLQKRNLQAGVATNKEANVHVGSQKP